ncbi:MAG: peptidase, partial [Verrucomicrobia bacterium]
MSAKKILTISLLAAMAASGAQFTFLNADGPGEGLNTTQAVFAVGGNPATTLGQQRLAALRRAGQIWGAYLASPVPIVVEVSFDPLGAGTLAAAGPEDIEQNFSGAPLANRWYPIALANS